MTVFVNGTINPPPLNLNLNLELDLQSLFGLLCTYVLIGWERATLFPPPHLGSLTRALLVSQFRRHLFVTSCWKASPTDYCDHLLWKFLCCLTFFITNTDRFWPGSSGSSQIREFGRTEAEILADEWTDMAKTKEKAFISLPSYVKN